MRKAFAAIRSYRSCETMKHFDTMKHLRTTGPASRAHPLRISGPRPRNSFSSRPVTAFRLITLLVAVMVALAYRGPSHAYAGPVFTSFTVYHPLNLPTGPCLYPVKHFVPPTPTPGLASMKALVAGLPAGLPAGLLHGIGAAFTPLPSGTNVLSVRTIDDPCTVDFSREIRTMNMGPDWEAAVVSAIVRTLSQFRDVNSVVILVEGKPVETLAGHVDVSRPLTLENCPTPVFTVFEDVVYHWAGGAVAALQIAGIAEGYEDGTFRPESKVSRAEFVKMLVEAMHLPYDPTSVQPFKDVAGHWADSYVRRAVASGVIRASDYGDYFMPDEVLPREEMAALLVAASSIYLAAHPEVQYEVVAPAPTFTDLDACEERFAASIQESVRLGLLKGFTDGTFRPKSGLTRGEAATVITRLLRMPSSNDILGMVPPAGSRWVGGSFFVLAAVTRAFESNVNLRITPTGGVGILESFVTATRGTGWGVLGIYVDGALLEDQSPASFDLYLVDMKDGHEYGTVTWRLDTGQAEKGGEWHEVSDPEILSRLWNDYLYDMAYSATFSYVATEWADAIDALTPPKTIPFIFRRACRDRAFTKAGITQLDGLSTDRIIQIIQEYAKRYLGSEIKDPWIMPLDNKYGWNWLGEPPPLPALNAECTEEFYSVALRAVTRNEKNGRYTAHMVKYETATKKPYIYLTYVLEERSDGTLSFIRGVMSLPGGNTVDEPW